LITEKVIESQINNLFLSQRCFNNPGLLGVLKLNGCSFCLCIFKKLYNS
jgi:hypothetical protein